MSVHLNRLSKRVRCYLEASSAQVKINYAREAFRLPEGTRDLAAPPPRMRIELSGHFASVAEIARETGLQPATVKAIRSRHKAEIEALRAESGESLYRTMRDQLLLTGVALMRNLKRRAELMPEDEPLDSGTAIQIHYLAIAYSVEKPSQKT